MALRLIAVDGELVDRPPRTIPVYENLTPRGRDTLYALTIGDVQVEKDGHFTLPVETLARGMGWDRQDAGNALHELQDEGFIFLVKPNYGPRPKVWRLHDRWNPHLSDQLAT